MNHSVTVHNDSTANAAFSHWKEKIAIGDFEDKSIILNYEGGDISSNAGALLPRSAEVWIGIIDVIIRVITDCRDSLT